LLRSVNFCSETYRRTKTLRLARRSLRQNVLKNAWKKSKLVTLKASN